MHRGESIEDITKNMTVEGKEHSYFLIIIMFNYAVTVICIQQYIGIPTAEVAVHLADRCNLELPIFRLVNALLKNEMKMDEAHVHLFGRPLRQEHDQFGKNNS